MRPAELRRDEEAAAALMQACSLGRDQAADWKRLAVVKLRLRKFDQAADCWRRVTDLPSVPGTAMSPFRLRRLMVRIHAHLAATGADGRSPPEAFHDHRPAA